MNPESLMVRARVGTGGGGEDLSVYKRSLAIRENVLCPSQAVAQSLNNLAELYTRQGRDADAEPLYKRSQAIREKTCPMARCR
jgi:Tetratricopeptide repeat